MRTNNTASTRFISAAHTVGTVGAWNDLIAADKAVKVKRMEWLTFFATLANVGKVENNVLTSLGAGEATKLSKAAVKYCANTLNVLPLAAADVSGTTLNKRRKAGTYTGNVADSISALWSLETRARQIEAATKQTAKPAVINANPVQAQSTAPVESSAPESPAVPSEGTKVRNTNKLPKLPAVTVARADLEMLLVRLDEAITSEDYAALAEARAKVAALLA